MLTIALRVYKLVLNLRNGSYSHQGPKLWFPLWVPEEFTLPILLHCLNLPHCPYIHLSSLDLTGHKMLFWSSTGYLGTELMCSVENLPIARIWICPFSVSFSTPVDSFIPRSSPVILSTTAPTLSGSRWFHTRLWREKPFKYWERRKMLTPIKVCNQ